MEIITKTNKSKERLGEILEYLRISANKLSKEIGHSNNVKIQHIKSGRNEISEEVASEIENRYPELNYQWILRGKGQMLKNTAGRDIITGGTNITGEVEGNATINIDNSSGFNKELSDAQEKNVALMEEKVDYLQSKIRKEEVELKEVVSLEVGSPYYNVDFINGFSSVEEIAHNTPEYNINYPPANHCEFWVNATGESMKGVIDNGDKIALKLVDKEWFPLGEVYAIVTTNGHRMVKKIAKSEDKECYRLVSANPDKNEFPDQDIPKKMIHTLFKVVTAIKLIN